MRAGQTEHAHWEAPQNDQTRCLLRFPHEDRRCAQRGADNEDSYGEPCTPW